MQKIEKLFQTRSSVATREHGYFKKRSAFFEARRLASEIHVALEGTGGCIARQEIVGDADSSIGQIEELVVEALAGGYRLRLH